MSTRLYWKKAVPAKRELPLAIKWAMEEGEQITVDFLRGFYASTKSAWTEEERQSVKDCIEAMESEDGVVFEKR